MSVCLQDLISQTKPTPSFPWWAQSSHSPQGRAPTADLWSYCLEWRSSTFWAALILWWLSVLYFAWLALHSTGQDCNCSVQDPHEFCAEQSEVYFHLLRSLSRENAPKPEKKPPFCSRLLPIALIMLTDCTTIHFVLLHCTVQCSIAYLERVGFSRKPPNYPPVWSKEP